MHHSIWTPEEITVGCENDCRYSRMMENIEDSGFDSDNKAQMNDTRLLSGQNGGQLATNKNSRKPSKKSTELHRKLERQNQAAREAAGRKSQQVVDTQPKKGLLSRNRLPVPSRLEKATLSTDTQPLVMLESDDSEDEFAVPCLSQEAHREITQQLIKDGYNLDLEPDDEDLDLIPPRPLHERCMCCYQQINCRIQ